MLSKLLVLYIELRLKFGFSAENLKKLVNVEEVSRETSLCLAAAHALVKLEDGTTVGDPMEKTTLDALGWSLAKGIYLYLVSPLTSMLMFLEDNTVGPRNLAGTKFQIHIRRRFQFSSALKRMSTVSILPNGRSLVAVKGAPETIKQFLDFVPEGYDNTYKWFTRKGSRVLALAMKEGDIMNTDKVCSCYIYK